MPAHRSAGYPTKSVALWGKRERARKGICSMRVFGRVTQYCVVALIALMFLSLRGQQTAPEDSALRNAAASGKEWLATGRDYSETRFSLLDQVNDTSIQRLGLAWYYDTDAEPGALEATPIVADGILYAPLTWDVVIAVDVRTGKLQWSYDPHLSHHNFPAGSLNDPNRKRTGPTMLSPVSRGVAFYDGKIYVGQLDGRLVALDAHTGKVVWEVHTTNPDLDYSITGAPRIIRGKVIIGNAGAEFATRGYVTAYDAKTGKQVWRFYTVPGDPSKPFENKAMKVAAKTWKGDLWYKLGGGGTVWDAFAYDPESNLVYFGTGNGGPWDRTWRSPGGGDNLYVSSILALDADTGKYVWHFQETPGDEWDYDAVQDLILANLTIDGTPRKVIMQASKNGFFYVLDRKTGKFLSAVPYAYVTWATGIDPKTGRPMESPNANYGNKGSFISPADGGAHNWQTMSFNPVTSLAYIPSRNSTLYFQGDPSHFIYKQGLEDRGLIYDPATPIFSQRQPPYPPGRPTGSFLLAWDPATQKEVWRAPDITGSTMTTAGNLVFSSSTDGHFVAFSADKGIKLWQAQLVPGFGSPVTYMVDGKQYISVLAGRSGHGRLYTFALDANTPMPAYHEKSTASSAAGGGQSIQDGIYSAAQAARGKAQYMQSCVACHMANLSGNGSAIPLTGDSFTRAWDGHNLGELLNIISTTMPQGAPNSLSRDSYTDIVAYLLQFNGARAGTEDLKSDPAILEHIRMTF